MVFLSLTAVFFDCGLYGDSPDGLVSDDGVIEIKSVTPYIYFQTLTRRSFDPAYKWQIIGHLDCSGRDWVDFVSYCADFHKEKQILIYRLARDEFQEEIKQLRERRDAFIEELRKKVDAIIE